MIDEESGSAIFVLGLGALPHIQSRKHRGIDMSTQNSADEDVAHLKRRFSNAMEGHEMFNCMVALTEQIVELLLTVDDRTPEDYDPFAVYFEMFEDALASAELVEIDELQELEREDDTRLH